MDWPQDNDRRLAVVARVCSASPEEAWGALSDVASWPSWYPGLLSAAGSMREGALWSLSFEGPVWRGGGRVQAVVDEVRPPSSLVFRARRAGLVGFHTFRVAVSPEGGCRISASAYFTGVRLPWLSRSFAHHLEGEQARALDSLVARLTR